MDYQTLINLKLKGLSNQKVADAIGVSRETVRKRWKKYCEEHEKLVEGGLSAEELENTKEKLSLRHLMILLTGSQESTPLKLTHCLIKFLLMKKQSRWN